MAERKLVVEVIGDDRSFQAAMNRSTAATTRFQAQAKKTQAASAAAVQGAGLRSNVGLFGPPQLIAAAAATAIIAKTTSAASDLNEQITKSQQVFGDSAESVRSWSETTASAFGISQRAALEASGTFGNLFRTVNISSEQSAAMSRRLTELAADLASFNNADPSETLLALRSGLIGEAEPLRRFGVLLSEARVQTEALATTGKSSAKQLTDQEKALARYRIILADTVPAQGDFARTSGDLANKQRALAAETEDLSANLGSVFVPAVTLAATTLVGLVGGMNDAIDAGRDLRDFFHDNNTFDGFNEGVQDASNGILDFGKNIRDQIPGMEAFLNLRDRIQGGGGPSESNFGDRFPAPSVVPPDPAKAARDTAAAGQAIVDSITRQVAAQDDLNRQLADSEARAAHLRDLIKEDPDNATLQQRLRRELERQAALRKQIAAAAASAARATAAEAAASKASAEQAARERRERQQAAREAKAAKTKGDQFEAIGLNRDGSVPAPTGQSELTRAKSLQQRIKGTPLDTEANRTQLARVVAFLKANYKKAGRDVRLAIDDMLDEIDGGFEGKKKSTTQGPLTKTTSLNTHKLLQGLGLSENVAREIQNRLSNFNSAGVGFAGSNATRPSGSFVGGTPNVTVENNVTVEIDGQKITATVTKQQQRARRRNPLQKRGPNRAGTGGH